MTEPRKHVRRSPDYSIFATDKRARFAEQLALAAAEDARKATVALRPVAEQSLAADERATAARRYAGDAYGAARAVGWIALVALVMGGAALAAQIVEWMR